MLGLRTKRIVLYLIFLTTLLVGCSSSPPSDDALLSIFENHTDDFEALVSMFTEDMVLEKVARNYTWPDNVRELGISRQRIKNYRELLEEAGLLSIERCREGILFTVYAGGALPDDGVYKGYAYFPGGPSARVCPSLVDDLDDLEWSPYQVTSACRQIDENWYLWFLA
jgi:hypothetical protein